ncbi:MAG: hypothetical protein KatS3mg110_1731 [Pirellulaceae bacterium]|nr:MAG: hypothetical protein KatS3mg110_1731 [Pirellulaceae bacterium]
MSSASLFQWVDVVLLRWAWGVFSIVILSQGMSKSGLAYQPLAVEDVFDALRQRQSEVVSYRIRVEAAIFEPALSLSEERRQEVLRDHDLRLTVPLTDRRYRRDYVISFDGGRLRIDAVHELPVVRPAGTVQEYRPVTFIEVFDGRQSKSFTPRDGHWLPYSMGTMQEGQDPVTWNVDTFVVPLSFCPKDWIDTNMETPGSATVRRVQHADKHYVIISGQKKGVVIPGQPKDSGSHSRSIELWLDVVAGQLPVKQLEYYDGRLSLQTTLSYALYRDQLWYPAAWETQLYDSTGKLQYESKCKLEVIELNVAVPNSVFQLEFPPNSLIYHRTGEGKSQTLVVQSDGTLHPADDEDVARLAGRASPGRRSAQVKWPLTLFLGLLGVAAVMALAVGFAWRRSRIRVRNQTPKSPA